MNLSSYGNNTSSVQIFIESFSAVVTKCVIVLSLGLIINFINGTLVHTFRKHEVFYLEPRYILFIHLVVNDIIQLTATIHLFVFAYIFNKVNAAFCCFIITIAILATANTPLNLAVMSLERYIAICLPLRHADLCTIKRTYIVIGWIWTTTSLLALPDLFITVETQPPEFFYSAIVCQRDFLFRHPVILQKRDVSYIIYLVGIWMTLFYTYLKVFFAAKTAGADAKKARNTIILHSIQLLLCMLTYIYPFLTKAQLFSIPLSDFVQLHFAAYIIIQILPRLISPILYGLRDRTFRQYLKQYLQCTLRRNETFCETFKKMGRDWTLSLELYEGLQEFTCKLYSSKSRITNISEMRYALFCAKKGIESWQLPPCSDSLRKHCLRANYQSAIWRRCLENNPEVPSPVEHGWSRAGQEGDLHLSVDWISVPTGPQAVLEFLSCPCRRDCVTQSCQCVANNLACTDLCHARQRKNQKDDIADEDQSYSSDDDDDDDEEFD
ncbi:odorant receptor 131-2-like [Thalassophryne amazonica]|uniref:odorant receptor 131-2-like n=1 Tax=Thalassophryne amazonica TaxID=390379 RepID=UPI001470D180|nr:odorant receptor 131-2-like [Thalassophryne amazonica]